MPDLFIRRATLAPQSADAEARTVEAVWTTGAAVRRRDAAGAYLERLSLDPSAVDLSRLIGASVLDAHRQSAVRDVLGTVRDARVDGRHGTAVLQFSARPEVEPIWQDVMAGILRHVSVGYTVERWRDDTDPSTGERVRTAVAWTPIEISLVPTPADPGATIRQGGTMPEIDTPPADAPENPPADQIETRAAINAEIRSIARIAGLGTEFADGLIGPGIGPAHRVPVLMSKLAFDGIRVPQPALVQERRSRRPEAMRRRLRGLTASRRPCGWRAYLVLT